MAPVHVLDEFYLALTLLITIAYQLLGFLIAWTCQFDKITDFTGGSNFFLLALLTLLIGNTFYARNIVASVLVMVWAARMASFLLLRVLKRGSDSRFDDIRAHFFSFLGFWIAQILWVWICSLPVIILNSPAVSDPRLGGSNPAFGTGRDIAGIVLWALGWIIETVADAQKFRYKSKQKVRSRPCNAGLWKWSRHPPYFGEMLVWWGIWLLCLSPTTDGSLPSRAKRAQVASIVSPFFTYLVLMFFSGVPTAERPQARRFYLMAHGVSAKKEHAGVWGEYKEYLRRTSVLIPIPPSVYAPIPAFLKKTLLMDFPFYHFDEKRDGPDAIEQDRKTT